jgi:hypothetical protein
VGILLSDRAASSFDAIELKIDELFGGTDS